MFKLPALLMVSPAWPYPDCENDISRPPRPYPDYGNDIWSKFSIYIRIIANLRPKIKNFIRTLERPTRGFSGVLRSVAPVSKPAPAKLHSPISKSPYLPNLDFGRNWNRRRCSAVIPFSCHTFFFSLALRPVLSFIIFIVSSLKCLIILPP